MSTYEPLKNLADESGGSLPSGSQVVVDAIDILAEDHTPRFAIQLVRSILKSLSNSKGRCPS